MDNNTETNYVLKFFQHSSHYLIGHILLILAGFISFPILTRVFSKSDYGLLSLISITLWLTYAISKMGLQESAIRFYNEFETGKRNKSIAVFYTTLFFGSLFFALLIAVIVFIIGSELFRYDQSPKINDLLLFIVLMIITGSMFLRVSNFLRAEQRTKTLNLVLVIHRYGGLLLGLSFIFLISKTLKSYYSGLILTESSIVFILTFILFKQQKIKISNFSINFLKECLIFGFPLIGFEMANFLIKSADRYLIQFMMGTEAVGIYSAGSNLCQYLKDGILFPVLYAITPLYIQIWNEDGKEKTKIFVSKIINYLFILVIPIVFGFIALGKQIVVILASKKFEQSASVIPFIIPGAILWGLSPLFAAGMYLQKKTKQLTFLVFIGIVLNIILNIILIPKMELIGAALATLITYFILIVLVTKTSSQYLKIDLNFFLIAKSLLASVIMYFTIISIQFEQGIAFLFIKVLIGSSVYSIVLFLIENKFRQNIFRLLRSKFSA